MNQQELKARILESVEEYVAKPEAWEEAQLIVDPVSGDVDILELEESDKVADSQDVYDMMDLIKMTPDGTWIPDLDAITEAASQEAPI